MIQKTAGGSGMELSILKLGSPRRRFSSGQFAFDFEMGNNGNNSSNFGTPAGTAPASPRGGFFSHHTTAALEEDIEMVFEQHRAAIPFVWEEKPGTPRGPSSIKEEEGTRSSGSDEDESDDMSQLNPSSLNSSTRETDDSPPPSEFEFSASETFVASTNSKAADELFARGQLLPLKPPPRLQSIKQLIAEDAAEESSMGYNSHRTLGHSFRKDGLRTPTRSFRKDGLRAFVSSPRREKKTEVVTTMLGFEEWPKDGDRKDGPGHRRTGSLSKLPALFKRKHGLGKENFTDCEEYSENFERKSSLGENRRPLDCLSSRTMDGSYGKNDFFDSKREFDIDARSDYFNSSGRILEEEAENLGELDLTPGQGHPRQKKQTLGKLSRFFRNKPSRLSAVAPTPLSSEELKIKRVHHSSPILKLCLSNCIGQALVRGVKHFRSLDAQPRRALSAAR